MPGVENFFNKTAYYGVIAFAAIAIFGLLKFSVGQKSKVRVLLAIEFILLGLGIYSLVLGYSQVAYVILGGVALIGLGFVIAGILNWGNPAKINNAKKATSTGLVLIWLAFLLIFIVGNIGSSQEFLEWLIRFARSGMLFKFLFGFILAISPVRGFWPTIRTLLIALALWFLIDAMSIVI